MSLIDRGSVSRGWRMCGPALAFALLAVSVSGCAHQAQTPYSQANWYAGGPKTPPPAPIPVEMEDDGRPAQLPPRVGIAKAPDDPSEPWSPNYGGPAMRPARPAVAPAPAGHQRVASADDES